jgi:hypothetical protein
VTDYFG